MPPRSASRAGIHPEFTGDFYVTVVEAIKEQLPDMHIHGFTPLEVWQGAETLGVSVRDFLVRLRDAGLGTLAGDRRRDPRRRCAALPLSRQDPDLPVGRRDDHGPRTGSAVDSDDHVRPHRLAASWANHFEVLRDIQRRTGGITEFVPLPFVHMGAPIYLRGRSRPGPTWDEVVLVHAVARIAFDGLIPNIQASWVKLGLDAGLRCWKPAATISGGP